MNRFFVENEVYVFAIVFDCMDPRCCRRDFSFVGHSVYNMMVLKSDQGLGFRRGRRARGWSFLRHYFRVRVELVLSRIEIY